MKTRLALLGVVSLALACTVGNNASVEVYGICVPPDKCTFGGKCDTYAMDPPILDLTTSPTRVLWLPIEVRDQLANNADPSVGRVNTNDAFVQEFEVDWKDAALPPQIGRIQQTVPTDGSSVISIWLTPPAAVGRYVADVRMRGIYANQSHFETATFEVPVVVCAGCLAAQATCTKPCPDVGQWPFTCGT